jgi:hypothetical protein
MNTTSMFESIKDALSKDKGSGGFGDILKTEIGNTYEVKILPNVNDPSKTFFHYYMHGWISRATGEYVSILSPTTFHERDPISEDRFKTLKLGTEEEQEAVKEVRRAEKWMVNVYVVKDPTNPDNEGKVKILRYGKQLQKVILDAIEGDDAEEFGEKVFDPNPGGAIFKIKVDEVKVDERNSYPSYTSSRFTTGTKFALDEGQLQEVFGQLHDLEAVYEPKSFEEVKKFYETHFKGVVSSSEDSESSNKSTEEDKEIEKKLINELSSDDKQPDTEASPDTEAATKSSNELTGDEEIDALLKDIE